MYAQRIVRYQEIERVRKSKLLVYVTGDRQNLETKISNDVLDFFVDHLDHIGVVPSISLFLYTRGGDTMAAWNLANLLRTFCDELEVIVPSKAHSGGTLIALAADRIIMTKQAALGPIDPSVSTPLNPQIQGAPPNARVPVNVENVNAFLAFARETLGDDNLDEVFLYLAQSIHPLVLGQAFRSRAQIRMLARRLLKYHMRDEDRIEKILDFLCSESGSHDYTVNRREGKSELNLPIDKPSATQYELIKSVYDDIAKELELNTPFDPTLVLGGDAAGTYSLPRALVESVEGGSDVFISEGTVTVQQIPTPQGFLQNAVQDQRTYEGWRHSNGR